MSDEARPARPSGAIYSVGAGILILVLWGWFLLERFTPLRLVRPGQEASAEGIPLLVPLIATPIVLIVAFALWRRAVGIAENGVPLQATVLSTGAALQGMRNVVLEYSLEGVRYERKTSVPCAIADKLSAGSTVDVVVDKRNPKRMLLA